MVQLPEYAAQKFKKPSIVTETLKFRIVTKFTAVTLVILAILLTCRDFSKSVISCVATEEWTQSMTDFCQFHLFS